MMDAIVIGGGQAGLAMGYHLACRGLDFVILDAAAETGDVWRGRWDSLRLFTPAAYSALPGMAFPAAPHHLPHKDEVADYLISYATKFDLPIRHSTRAAAVRRCGDSWEVTTSAEVLRARSVIVATGPFQKPMIPSFANELAGDVASIHSSEYRNPAQIPGRGRVLVVGAGNSGVQIAAELARVRPVTLAGPRLPRVPQSIAGRSIFEWLDRSGIMDVTVTSGIGRVMRGREWLIGARPAVQRIGRLTSAGHLDVDAVIWATGFRSDYSFIDAPVFDSYGNPRHRRGVTAAQGLYFLGLPWQLTRGSALLGWVGWDAEHLADCVSAETRFPNLSALPAA